MARIRYVALNQRLLFVALLSFCAALPAATQPPPAESCDGTENLDGSATVPQFLSFVPQSNDFDMSAPGCVELGLDHVTCFVPESNCSVNIACEVGGRGLQVGANVLGAPTRTAQDRGPGTCNQSPSSCTTSNSGTGAGSLTGVSLLAGVEYCVVCEVGGGFDLDLSITANTGDCGALPVSLQSFSIDAAEEER